MKQMVTLTMHTMHENLIRIPITEQYKSGHPAGQTRVHIIQAFVKHLPNFQNNLLSD
jgi:hypothetical protein